MGRRGVGHQPANERRGVTASRAIDFSEAAASRFRRTGVSWVRPVAEVLRALPRLLRIENRVYVDARTLRVVTAPPGRAAGHGRRIDCSTAPVLTRLVERARLDEAVPAAARRPAAVPSATVEHLHRPRRVEPRSLPPAPLVLARVAAPPESTFSASSVAVSGGWPSPSTGHARPSASTAADNPHELSPTAITHLTDRVVAAIDRRMLAARERLGV